MTEAREELSSRPSTITILERDAYKVPFFMDGAGFPRAVPLLGY